MANRCLYHRRAVGRKEAREKCRTRGCHYFKDDKLGIEKVLKQLDKWLGKEKGENSDEQGTSVGGNRH